MTSVYSRAKYDARRVLISLGMTEQHAAQLLRISNKLRNWHELECGNERGAIERDEETGELRWYSYLTHTWGRYYGQDTETSSKRLLARIMAEYPTLTPYIQGDPRGCALYILRPGDVPAGEPADAYYSRGIAVYKE